MRKKRLDIEKRAFAIVQPDIGCPSGYPTVNEITLREVIEQEKDEDQKSQLSGLLTELQELETQKSSSTRLTERAIELLATVNDVINYLTSTLADDSFVGERSKIQNAIEELRDWPEKDVESRKCASLNQDYKELLRICAANRYQFLESIDPSYFIPRLRELLMKDISPGRREEVENLIKEIEERG